MKKVRLGKTELMVSKLAFGALPIQRTERSEAIKILRTAYENGINYFDTANMYTDSEEKIGLALHDVRGEIVISTKTGGRDKATAQKHIENSLRMLKTDYIDLLQLHNPPELPRGDDEQGAYAAALEAKCKGYVRHIGITNHKLFLAEDAVDSGLFETLQFPFCHISTDRELALAEKCAQNDMGFIAMKGLSGGLLTNIEACYAFMEQYENVVPIWGIQHMRELEEWLELEKKGAELTKKLQDEIRNDRELLGGDFCRSCGYCLPCAADIEIFTCARMKMLLRRAPYKQFLTDEIYSKMQKINDCIGCGQCKTRCPYGLDTPNLLKEMLKDYNEFYEQHKHELG